MIDTITTLRRTIDAEIEHAGKAEIQLADVSALDTAGAWFVIDLAERLKTHGASVAVTGATDRQSDLIQAVTEALPTEAAPGRAGGSLTKRLEDLGRAVKAGYHEGLDLLGFLGLVIARMAGLAIRPWRLRFISLVHHMEEIGFNAVPIVALMAFLIGVVLAFQGAAQLRQFGAEVFVVDLIAISVLRELGVLLTAIIVAGRSGSAFTASIGAMKMREEIDALQTLGLDPVEVLVAPRVLALILMLPVLSFIADISGLVGGALMSWMELGVSPGVFQARMIDAVDANHFLIGMVKAPFFAVLIGVIGCHQGMQVEGNSESLGRLTSKSVVLSIFGVIVIDAAFSIFFSLVGL